MGIKFQQLILFLFLPALFSPIINATSIQMKCGGVMNLSNTLYIYPSNSCLSGSRITFANNTHNISLECLSGQLISSTESIIAGDQVTSAGIYNCTIKNPTVYVGSGSSLYLMGNSINSTKINMKQGSNVVIGHYLRINVFAPNGFNSTKLFGDRVAGFSYVFPLINHTVDYNDTELQMGGFFIRNFSQKFKALQKTIPFGAYDMNGSQIFENFSNVSYGRLEGWKILPVVQYFITNNSIINFNPYAVDYSFLAFDQLVMYRLNITRDVNLTPIYIQPIYPTFNWNIIPDNFSNIVKIRYIVSIPPSDANWNFTDYLYRYSPLEFVLNPVSGGVGPHSILYRAFTFPNKNYSKNLNGSLTYLINYTEKLAIGLNSSIMTAQGTIPGLGSFIQDSTTPSFSIGIGFCAVPYNMSVQNINYITLSNPGEYQMASNLRPLAEPALPQLVNAPCSTGIVISGNNIQINCNNWSINDTISGVLIKNSSNIIISDCKINGNGITINNSKGISLYNITLTPTAANSSGISINDALGVTLYNLTLNNGYKSPFSVFSSSGTPFSEAIQIHNLMMCGADNISAVSHFAFIYNSKSTCPSQFESILYKLDLNPKKELIILSLVIAIIYILLAAKYTSHNQEKKLKIKRKAAKN